VVKLPVEVVDDRPAVMRTLSRRLELLQEARVERLRQYRDSTVAALKEALRIIEAVGSVEFSKEAALLAGLLSPDR
jgi:hypothetical protein